MAGMKKKLLIALLMLVITYLHYATETHHQIMHVIHRELFLIPILLAAYWFGKKTGVLVAIISSILFLPQVVLSEKILSSYGLSSILEILTFNIVAYLLGGYQDIRKSRYTQEWKPFPPKEDLPQRGHNVLVCIDNSQNAFKVIPYVIDYFAIHQNMSITIMGFIREPARNFFDKPEEYGQAKEKSEKSISDLIEDGRNRLLSAGFPPEQMQIKLEKLAGQSVASGILEALQNSKFDNVVIGGFKMTKAEEFVLGNTAVKLVRESNSPVVIVY
jgi:nucleotide-binding universal stress UspA family protein